MGDGANPGPPERHLPETLLMDRGSLDESSADSQEPLPPDTRRDGKSGSRILNGVDARKRKPATVRTNTR